MDTRYTTGATTGQTHDSEENMAKAKKSVKGRPGRTERSPSGPTRPTTFRIAPSGMASILRLSQRLDLRSQATAIEFGVHQLLTMIEKCDSQPPLSVGQLDMVATAIRAAGVQPRTLGATANFTVVLTAAVMAAESVLVPAEGSSKAFGELVAAVKAFGPAEALWAIGQVIGE